jgi:hypothetical protein
MPATAGDPLAAQEGVAHSRKDRDLPVNRHATRFAACTHRSLDLTPPATIGCTEQMVSCSPSVKVTRRSDSAG